MRKILTQILILVSTVSFGQELTSIKVTVPNKSDEVYIVGNQKKLGDWVPDKIKMNKVSPYEREISLDLSYPAELKFTRGNWESEANVVDYESGDNIVLTKNSNQYQFEIENWKDEKIENSKFSLKYDVKYLTSSYYPNEERVLKVFLPKNYTTSQKYPVLYTLDGQNLFHLVMQNVSVLQDKSYDDNNIIPECIVVAIDNTNRRRDLTPNMGLNSEVPLGEYAKDSETFYKIINQIEKSRSKNNVNWMDILRLAYSKSPKESVKIFTKIFNEDKAINKLAKKLTKL